MNEFYEGVRSALAVWPLWLILAIFALIAWKMPKSKGKQVIVNQDKIAHIEFMAQFIGMPQSNGLVSPIYLMKQERENRDQF